MDTLLKQLKRAGVRSIKNDFDIMLELSDAGHHRAAKIDSLISDLLTGLGNSRFEKVLFECSEAMLNNLHEVKKQMRMTGKRVVYTKPLTNPIEKSTVPYHEVCPITRPNAISLLSEVMGRSFRDAEKFLKGMKTELPSQADNMYTVYMVDGEPIGVVLPHIEPDTDKEGRMFWIGVHPVFRGKGYGRLLHLIGLYRLQHEFGATSYYGVTKVDNTPMQNVMSANGCVRNNDPVISLAFSVSHEGQMNDRHKEYC
ncbi:GNAT family N-acetyltransferase [Lentibacillus salicampi]|uniref:GNAT family N-acetyltransferase n=1 Tax=Lentibacillus salicampi TaxID=175306 RepID=A0A4Y9A902_9BACI|nr:GNAT family N-acetyltransferase [Lentibacillus salicampi]TFJ92338.1 GNAT family N-acetyltransferase [Lentibacillus salicampi]